MMMNVVVWESYLRSGKLEGALENEGEVRSEQEHPEHPAKFKH